MLPDSIRVCVRFTQVFHLNAPCPGPLREGLDRTVIDPNVLMGHIPQGDAPVHWRAPQELDTLSVLVKKVRAVVWVEHSYWGLIWHFGP